MTNSANQPQATQLAPAGDNESIQHFKQAITAGQHWYISLLEAIGLWNTAEETYRKRIYRYLIAGEAFDWLLLAERLCETADGLLPEDEKTALLFSGQPPLELTSAEFKELIGTSKYHQYLNYFYGITTEEALIGAVQNEIRKERHTLGHNNEVGITDEVYQRIYGSNKADLLILFRRGKGYPQRHSISLTQLKEFTYWLFKYRLNHCDKARVASDTQKALAHLKGSGFAGHPATAKSDRVKQL